MITINSREFNQRLAYAKQQAQSQPVVITNRGKPELVLLNHDEYCRLVKQPESIADAIGYTEAADIDFEPERVAVGFRDTGL